MHIITDTSSLFSPQDGTALGITVIPACVLINGEVYRDYADIDSDAFLRIIEAGNIPTSSQPVIGEVLEICEQNPDELLYLTIGDGLSGTYANAVGARNCIDDNARIHVVDTKTLAGAQRYLVQKAIRLCDAGLSAAAIVAELQSSIDSSVFCVIPSDFDFLKRSGRLTPFAANLGGAIKIVPVMTQTEDMRRIRPFALKRSRKKAVEAILSHLEGLGVGDNHRIYVCHGGALQAAKEVSAQIQSCFTHTSIEVYPLAPALITHGGPGCIVIQAIHQ